MTTLLDISDDAIYTALSALIAVIVPGSTPINRGQQNRIPMPAEDCVYITTIGAPRRIGTNADQIVVNESQSPPVVTGFDALMTADFEYTIQADFYSPDAESWALAMELLWRDKIGWALMPDGMKPLYSEGLQQLPIVGAENQWIQRWTMTLVLDYQPTLTLPIQAMTTAEVIPEPIDVFFPAT